MLYVKLIAVASPEAESNTNVPDKTRAWRAFDFEIGLVTFLENPAPRSLAR